jgi:hypothetical protein
MAYSKNVQNALARAASVKECGWCCKKVTTLKGYGTYYKHDPTGEVFCSLVCSELAINVLD